MLIILIIIEYAVQCETENPQMHSKYQNTIQHEIHCILVMHKASVFGTAEHMSDRIYYHKRRAFPAAGCPALTTANVQTHTYIHTSHTYIKHTYRLHTTGRKSV